MRRALATATIAGALALVPATAPVALADEASAAGAVLTSTEVEEGPVDELTDDDGEDFGDYGLLGLLGLFGLFGYKKYKDHRAARNTGTTGTDGTSRRV